MKPDLTWLTGRRLNEVNKKDYSWVLILDDGSSITTESTWRLVTADGIGVSSEDHGQQFGLSTIIDAGNILKIKIGSQIVDRYDLNPRTGDLSLYFNGTTEIEFLNLSSGYEGWHIIHGDQEIVCMGGGRLSEINRRDK